jgi:hypothetical protein
MKAKIQFVKVHDARFDVYRVTAKKRVLVTTVGRVEDYPEETAQ